MAVQDSQVFVLPVHMTVDKVQDIREQIVEFLQTAGKQIKCISNEVQEVDAAGLQLLLSMYKAIVKDGGKMVIVNPSQELKKVITYSGADKVFRLEES